MTNQVFSVHTSVCDACGSEVRVCVTCGQENDCSGRDGDHTSDCRWFGRDQDARDEHDEWGEHNW